LKRFPSPRCASAIQIVRPLESIAEAHPNANTYAYGYTHTYGNTNADRNTYCHSKCNADSCGDGDTEEQPVAEISPYSAASPNGGSSKIRPQPL
jgi:hypothetical protein